MLAQKRKKKKKKKEKAKEIVVEYFSIFEYH